jgi:hypothetical protein
MGERFVLMGFPTVHTCVEGCEEDSHLASVATEIDLGASEEGIMVGIFAYHPGAGIVKYASLRASTFGDLASGVPVATMARVFGTLKTEVEKRAKTSALGVMDPTLAPPAASNGGPIVPGQRPSGLVIPDVRPVRKRDQN